MATKQNISKAEGDNERLVDVLERFAAANLYMSTPLGQTDIAKVLGMDNNRINKILKGIKKPKTNAKEKE